MIMLKLFADCSEDIVDGHRFVKVDDLYGKWFWVMLAVLIFLGAGYVLSENPIIGLISVSWAAVISIYGARISYSHRAIQNTFKESETCVMLTKNLLTKYVATFPSDGYIIYSSREPIQNMFFNTDPKYFIGFCEGDWKHERTDCCDLHETNIVMAVTSKENATLLRLMR